jgi:hypothetical protein
MASDTMGFPGRVRLRGSRSVCAAARANASPPLSIPRKHLDRYRPSPVEVRRRAREVLVADGHHSVRGPVHMALSLNRLLLNFQGLEPPPDPGRIRGWRTLSRSTLPARLTWLFEYSSSTQPNGPLRDPRGTVAPSGHELTAAERQPGFQTQAMPNQPETSASCRTRAGPITSTTDLGLGERSGTSLARGPVDDSGPNTNSAP